MFKERIKTSIIIILIINLVSLTYQSWFKSGILGDDWLNMSFSSLPFVRFFSSENSVSVPKENLSKARKVVLNDGSFWYPYYNTDSGFDTLNEKAADIFRSLLKGKATKEENISYSTWLGYLSSPSVYVEYPISAEPEMFSRLLNTSYEKLNSDIETVRDFIIIPEGEDGVSVAVRDAHTNRARRFYIKDSELSFPEEVLLMYSDRYPRDGYYEFAFSALMGQMNLGESGVVVGDMVLFSDNDSNYRDIYASNPMSEASHGKILTGFSFSPNPLRHYRDDFGAENYVENYATVRIFPDGYIEYSAVENDKGIDLEKSESNRYEVLNSVIDFSEKIWKAVSDEPLNVLVSGIETIPGGTRITFDYYHNGREVAVGLLGEGRDKLNHAIEVETFDGKIVSYRQYLRHYTEAGSSTKQENFNQALDYFALLFNEGEETIITDIYLGYFDSGRNHQVLKTTWLGEVNNSDERFAKK